MGIGVLVSDKPLYDVIIKGGTGYNSIELVQPDSLPERIESGTVNLPAIVAAESGIEFIKQKGITNIYKHELALCRLLYDELNGMDCELYGEEPVLYRSCPVLSFNVKGRNSDEIGKLLSQNGIAVRCGLHCAPLAHKQLETLKRGTVRVSPAIFNSKTDIDRLIFVLKKQI
jgi:selenocysteine lyase/cysteine desulfurase